MLDGIYICSKCGYTITGTSKNHCVHCNEKMNAPSEYSYSQALRKIAELTLENLLLETRIKHLTDELTTLKNTKEEVNEYY